MSKAAELREMVKVLERQFRDFWRGLDRPDKQVLELHVDEGSRGLRQGMWDLEMEPKDKIALGLSPWTDISQGSGATAIYRRLEDMLRRGPRTEFPMTVYRGGAEPIGTRARRYPYPVSTSIEPGPAAEFGLSLDPSQTPRFDEVRLPERSPGLYLEPLARAFDVDEEMEFLLPRGPLTLLERADVDRLKRLRDLMTQQQALNPKKRLSTPQYEEYLDLLDEYSTGKNRNLYDYNPPFRRGGALRMENYVG